jgi:hypothetical protein
MKAEESTLPKRLEINKKRCLKINSLQQIISSIDKIMKSETPIFSDNEPFDYKKAYEALIVSHHKLVKWYDKYEGTPCEQIRHEQDKKEYARIQIEKDRERVKKALLPTMAFGSATIIDSLPITLY